jgi:anti-sigma-K factor RskA
MTGGRLWETARVWQRATAVLATLCLALLVAAIIARDPPDFSTAPVVAIVRDGDQHPIWAIRLARAAHLIAVDSLYNQSVASGHIYQLWLLAPGLSGPRQLGLLPLSGRKPIAVSPETARLLTGVGELIITLEPSGGSPNPAPSGPALYQTTLENSG